MELSGRKKKRLCKLYCVYYTPRVVAAVVSGIGCVQELLDSASKGESKSKRE